jgi:hypothetical protein
VSVDAPDDTEGDLVLVVVGLVSWASICAIDCELDVADEELQHIVGPWG